MKNLIIKLALIFGFGNMVVAQDVIDLSDPSFGQYYRNACEINAPLTVTDVIARKYVGVWQYKSDTTLFTICFDPLLVCPQGSKITQEYIIGKIRFVCNNQVVFDNTKEPIKNSSNQDNLIMVANSSGVDMEFFAQYEDPKIGIYTHGKVQMLDTLKANKIFLRMQSGRSKYGGIEFNFLSSDPTIVAKKAEWNRIRNSLLKFAEPGIVLHRIKQ